MASISFKKATRVQRKFKGAIIGVSGSGKTWTALEIATGLKGDGKICLLDTEQSSASLYADDFVFDSADLIDHTARSYIGGIESAEKAGYSVLVIDSLSHAWESLLEEVDNVQARGKGNSFTAWKSVTPIYRELVEAIVRAQVHIIATIRAKSDYVMEEVVGENGKTRTVPKKVGLAPIFRAGGEYEFDWIGTIDLDHRLVSEKSRLPVLADKVWTKPTHRIGVTIREWLYSAPPAPEQVIASVQLAAEKVGLKLAAEERTKIAVEKIERIHAIADQRNATTPDTPPALSAMEKAVSDGDLEAVGGRIIETAKAKYVGETVQHVCDTDRAWAEETILKNPHRLLHDDRVALEGYLIFTQTATPTPDEAA